MREDSKLCIACNGGRIPCKGGGNLRCWRRDPKPSILAGILDTYGGFRVVVTYREFLYYHVRCDELCVIAPIVVHEPIAWNDIPFAIGRAGGEMDKWVENNWPNEAWKIEAIKMYKLRKLEQDQASFDLSRIAQT
jgi:hypothetical protein